MTTSLEQLLAELERFGQTNDAAITERARRMLNITRDTGEFLELLVRAMSARRILEIGTSNGYSTLWFAKAASIIGGQVTTVEQSTYKIELASKNFERSGLSSYIRLVHSEASAFMSQLERQAFDLIFLDSERSEYVGWWPHVRSILRTGGMLVADNATSHAEEMRPFISTVRAELAFITSLVPIGNGEFLALKVA